MKSLILSLNLSTDIVGTVKIDEYNVECLWKNKDDVNRVMSLEHFKRTYPDALYSDSDKMSIIPITKELIESIQDKWVVRRELMDYGYNKKTKFMTEEHKKAQMEFFVGACAALNYIVPYWLICIQSSREIVPPKTK